MKIGVYVLKGNGLASKTCHPMAEGASLIGDVSMFQLEADTKCAVLCDVAVMWGYVQSCQDLMAAYRAEGKPVVYLDLAYWARDTYFKVSVNARHPTLYFQKIKHDDTRRKRFNVPVAAPWRTQGSILVAGMGPKAAWAEKEEPVESWERKAIQTIKQYSDKHIIYRPKPSQGYGKPIAGTELDVTTSLNSALSQSFAVVTHHSNVAVDGLVAGVPSFCWHGVATPMSSQDLSKIEEPKYPEGRDAWLNDISYCQWSLDEMRDGTVWRHLKKEGLL